MRARLACLGLAALLAFSTPACQSDSETANDGERSLADQGVAPVTTATSISVGERTTFLAGDTITLRAEVTPAPDEGIVLFFPTIPVNVGAPAEDVVSGVAIRRVICGTDRVPTGSHTARAAYQGTSAYLGSSSETISYTCSSGD